MPAMAPKKIVRMPVICVSHLQHVGLVHHAEIRILVRFDVVTISQQRLDLVFDRLRLVLRGRHHVDAGHDRLPQGDCARRKILVWAVEMGTNTESSALTIIDSPFSSRTPTTVNETRPPFSPEERP